MPKHSHPRDVGGNTYFKIAMKTTKDKIGINAVLNILLKAFREEANPSVFVFYWTGPEQIMKAGIVYRDRTKHFMWLKPELSRLQKQQIRKRETKQQQTRAERKILCTRWKMFVSLVNLVPQCLQLQMTKLAKMTMTAIKQRPIS